MEVNIPSVTTSWTAPVFKACTGMNTQYLRIQNLWNVYGIHKASCPTGSIFRGTLEYFNLYFIYSSKSPTCREKETTLVLMTAHRETWELKASRDKRKRKEEKGSQLAKSS